MAAHALDWVIQWTHAARGANGSPWWWYLWFVLCWVTTPILYYSYRTKPTEQEFFVSAQTKIVVKLLSIFAKVDEAITKVDTCQLLFPSASLDRIAGWRADHISRGRDCPLSLRTSWLGTAVFRPLLEGRGHEMVDLLIHSSTKPMAHIDVDEKDIN